MMPRPVALIVLDGWGLAPAGPGNAISQARTPNFDRYWQSSPRTTLEASGSAVGLPEGQIGNSEVGHMNLGAGRVVKQSLTYLQSLIDDGSFFENEVLNRAYEAASGHALHLMGLVSRGGVHSDLSHLFALLELAKRKGTAPVYVHAFTDGRDVPPNSGLGFLEELEGEIARLDHDVGVATVIGRYYAMDRDRRWERIKRAYDAVVCAHADHTAASGTEAVRQAYARGETDEFIQPTVITRAGEPVATLQDGDSVVFFNFRADRARQLSYALLKDEAWNDFTRCRRAKIHYASLMEYDHTLGAPFAFALPEIHDCLAGIISEAGLRQYHTAETEKYPHVTYFFNAEREEPFPGEERKLVPSPQEVPTYDLKPEMSAPELTEATLERLSTHDDAFILLNYANPDMVGHTGVLQAAIEAVETVDEGLGRLVDAVLEKGGAAVILADHGNAEVMLDERGEPHTAHTTNPVPCLIVGAGELRLREDGVLGDVAPTVLELLGLKQPEAMSGRSLIVR
jgi:2,3-bisphosphoglycerate-independent phosphoglycerate mutase